MNINIKNCEVNIIKGTDTLEISGNARPAESKESGCISEMTYSMAAFMANRDKVRIGDRVRLPAFTVPAVKMIAVEQLAYPYKTIGGKIIPQRERDCSIEECSKLIEAAQMLAADLGIIVRYGE